MLLDFDTLDRNARANGSYDDLSLDEYNDVELTLLSDRETAVVMQLIFGQWCEIYRFDRESWSGGHWSDVDISRALEHVRAFT